VASEALLLFTGRICGRNGTMCSDSLSSNGGVAQVAERMRFEMLHLSLNPSKAPRRKLRGKKRYFREVIQKAESFSISPQEGDWWEFWHYHADWPGWGNLGWKLRLEHLRALAIVFRRICHAKMQFSTPFQSWIHLDAEDAGCDAVFLHSPNKNRDSFPWKPERVRSSTAELDPLVSKLFPDMSVRVVLYGVSESSSRCSTACILYSPDVGVPLE
jgi:hypothetical protein